MEILKLEFLPKADPAIGRLSYKPNFINWKSTFTLVMTSAGQRMWPEVRGAEPPIMDLRGARRTELSHKNVFFFFFINIRIKCKL